MANTKKLKLKIEGMHCSSCAILIDGDLEDASGVKSARTSFYKQECEVEIEAGTIQETKLVEIIKKTGYTAEIV